MTTSCLQRHNSPSFIVNKDGTKRRATKLEVQHLQQKQQQQNQSEPTSPTPTTLATPTVTSPEKLNRNFVNSTFTKSFIRVADLVLILIPEEMQIIDSVDPEYHMQMGYILKLSGDEALVQLKQTKETIFVPIFCLCLEDQVLYSRIREYKKNCHSPTCSSPTNLFIQHQRLPQL